ncbi:hypothetical protein Goari_027263 [Gossypium aridum]|uniref:Uncharacterized protein n=1 Tax=Gossypium aridum TaxID=34290 RepID=A0A7J8YUF6_GOSAI|nr:hypothetical protein [Gossypium aridum]
MISSVCDTDSTSIPPKHLPAEYLDENIQVEEELEIYAATKGYKRRNYTEEEEELEIGATILGFMDELMEKLGELFVAHSIPGESTTGQKVCPCHFDFIILFLVCFCSVRAKLAYYIYLHRVTGVQEDGFYLDYDHDIALVNKHLDWLKEDYKIPGQCKEMRIENIWFKWTMDTESLLIIRKS